MLPISTRSQSSASTATASALQRVLSGRRTRHHDPLFPSNPDAARRLGRRRGSGGLRRRRAPIRLTSAVVKVVPVAGDVVAAPLDVTADAID